MDAQFWRERWRENRIGFHQGATNRFLVRFAEELRAPGQAPRPTVLVPFCGKSRDMTYLASLGHRVLGVELVEEALLAFFTEQDLPFSRREERDFVVLEGEKIELWAGDFLALNPDQTGPVGCAYDRAALVALPEEMRARYAAQLLGLLPPKGRILLITFFYPAEAMQGPPFSIPPEEVARLFEERCACTLLTEEDALVDKGKFQGLPWMKEAAWLLEKK